MIHPRPCLLLALAAGLAAATLDDFERPAAGFTALAPAEATLVPAPDGGGAGNALRLAWPDKHGRWIEGFYPASPPIADLRPGAPVMLRLWAWLPPAAGIRGMGIRLLDARNETWQWVVKVSPPAAGGWTALAVLVSLEQDAGHWGGDNDGVPEPPLRLGGYSASFADEHVPAGQIVLDQVVADPLPAIRLATDRFPALVDPGGRCELVVANRQDAEVTVEMTASSLDWAGRRSEGVGRVVLAAHAEGRLPLPLGDRPGIHTLAWTLRCDGLAIPGSGRVAVTAPVPAGSRDGFRFGICSHPDRRPAAEQEQEMQAAAAAGASVMRCSSDWSRIEPKPGEWRWEDEDRLVELAARHGIELQAMFGFCPGHAASEAARLAQAEAYRKHAADAWRITTCSPPEDAPWRTYIAAMATRYRGRIRMYEVWNEPDLGFFRGTTEAYIRMLRSADEEVRKADPGAEVMTGGFATVLTHPGRALNPDLQERVLAEAGDAFAIHAVHQHGPFAEFHAAVTGELARIRGRMATPRPLYFNETAMCAYGGSPAAEREQADELVKKMAWVVASGAIGYTWYDLRNDGANRNDPEQNYGLLTWDFQPKPAFPAYAELVRRLRGTRHIGDLALGDGRYGLVFAAPGRRVAVLWREDAHQPDEPIALRVGGPARLVDIQGGSEDLAVVDGVTVLQLTAAPRYLEMPGGGQPPEVAPLLTLRGDVTVVPCRPADFVAVARNPLATPLPLHLSWGGPAGAGATRDLDLATGATAETAVTIPVGTDAAQAAEIRWNAGPWQGALHRPLQVVRDIGSAPPEGREPDLVLAARNAVVNLCGADPALAAHVWHGPDDLSARLWWWCAGGALHLQVDVRDDEHHQLQSVADQWRGDGLQFALQVPGRTGYWELGAARRSDDGTIMRACWLAPAGDSGAADACTAEAVPIAGGMRYRIGLPCARFGLDAATLRDGFRFNLIVNDDDGGVREGFVRLAPGIGESKDPAAFPRFRVAGGG